MEPITVGLAYFFTQALEHPIKYVMDAVAGGSIGNLSEKMFSRTAERVKTVISNRNPEYPENHDLLKVFRRSMLLATRMIRRSMKRDGEAPFFRKALETWIDGHLNTIADLNKWSNWSMPATDHLEIFFANNNNTPEAHEKLLNLMTTSWERYISNELAMDLPAEFVLKGRKGWQEGSVIVKWQDAVIVLVAEALKDPKNHKAAKAVEHYFLATLKLEIGEAIGKLDNLQKSVGELPILMQNVIASRDTILDIFNLLERHHDEDMAAHVKTQTQLLDVAKNVIEGTEIANRVENKVNELTDYFLNRVKDLEKQIEELKNKEKTDLETEKTLLLYQTEADLIIACIKIINTFRAEDQEIELDELLLVYPRNRHVLMAKAYIADDRGQWKKAKLAYEQVLKYFPDDDSANNNYAILLANHFNDLEGARIHCEKAIDANPKFIEAYCLLGKVLLLQKNYGRATQQWDKALALDPSCQSALDSFADYYASVLNDHEKAVEFFKKAIELNPNSYEPFLAYAIYLHNEKQAYGEALQYYQQALIRGPYQAHIYYNIGILLIAHFGKQKEAKINFLEAIRLSPTSTLYRYEFALYLCQFFGDYAMAKHQLEDVIAMDPDHHEAYFNLGVIYGRHFNLPVHAYTMFSKAVELKPTNGQYHFDLAMICKKLKEGDKARFHFQEAIKNGFATPDLYCSFGVLLFEFFKDFEASEIQLKNAIELDPNHFHAHNCLSVIYTEFYGDFHAALAELNIALSIIPDNQQAHLNYSIIAIKHLSQPELLRIHIENMSAKFPEQASVLIICALLANNFLQDRILAVELYLRTISIDPSLKDEKIEQQFGIG